MNSSTVLNTIYFYTANLALVCLCINVVFCLVYRKKLSVPFRRLFYFLIWNLIIEILALSMYLGYNNLPLLHLYTLGEFMLFSYLFKSLIQKPSFFQRGFWYFVLGGSLLIVLNSVFVQNIYGFNTYAKTFVQITIIGYAVLYFYNLVENQVFSPGVSKGLRLINSAIMVYYSGSLFIFMCSQISFGNDETYVIFWTFNAILNFVFQLLILLGLWKVFFKKKAL